MGGSPSVSMNTFSDTVRSTLELDITMLWGIEEAHQLMIDLGSMFGNGVPLEDDIAMFAKGMIVSSVPLIPLYAS